MVITIDDREHKIIEKIDTEKKRFKISHLDVGDFIISHGSEIKLIIERKTWDDFIASKFKEDRLREQLIKLIEFREKHNCNIVIIIEGKYNSDFDFNLVKKALNHLIIYFGINIIYAKTIESTINKIENLYFDSKEKNEIKISKIIGGVKLKKKNKNIFVSVLCGIPGISIKNAEKLNAKYKNLTELKQGIINGDKIPGFGDKKINVLKSVL